MLKMTQVKATKNFASSAAASRRRCHVLAARPGTCIFFLVRQMSRSAASPAPRRKKRSEQTVYDAATREVLQIDFPPCRKRLAPEKMRVVVGDTQIGSQNNGGKESAARAGMRPRRLFPAKQVRNLPRNRKEYQYREGPHHAESDHPCSPVASNFDIRWACRMPVVHVEYL
jgi:hypothetical protein